MNQEWIKRPRLYTPGQYDEFRVRITATSFTYNRPTMTSSTVELYREEELLHTVVHRPNMYGNRPTCIASYIEGIKCMNFLRSRIAPPQKRIVFELGDVASFLGWSRQRSPLSSTERKKRHQAMKVPYQLQKENPELEIYFLLAEPGHLLALEEYVEYCRSLIKIVPYYEDIYGRGTYCEEVRLRRNMLRLWQRKFTSQV